MTIRSYLVATSARFSTVAGSPNRPVGLSGTVASTAPIRRPAARAPSIGTDERGRVADAALAGRGGHEMRPGPDQAGLGRVAHPAWLGHGDIRADGQQQAEQQRLGARPGDHRVRSGRQATPGPVARGRLTQGGLPGHRAVRVAAGRGGQRGLEQRVHRQPGLAERQREDGLTGLPLADEDLVRGEGGRQRDGGHVGSDCTGPGRPGPAQASRSMGQLMQRGPPRPRPSSPPGTVITSMPLSRR